MKIFEIVTPNPLTKQGIETLNEYFEELQLEDERHNIINDRAWFEYLKSEDYQKYKSNSDPASIRPILKRQILELLLEDEKPAIEKYDIEEKYNILCKLMIKNMTRADSRPGRGPDDPFIVYPHLNRTFTKRELATELENQTDIGVELVSKITLLAFDLFARQKENVEGIEYAQDEKK